MALFNPGERVAVGDRIGVVAYVEVPYVFVSFDKGEPEPHTLAACVSIPSFG